MRFNRSSFAVIATYVYFLLFAQFGFLHAMQTSGAAVEIVMACMGIAGLAASFATAKMLSRMNLLRAGLVGCAVAAIASLPCRTTFEFSIVAAGIGGFTAMTTVSLAARLHATLPVPYGASAGLATGLAYFICNIPPLFAGSFAVRALVPAALCMAAAAAVKNPEPEPRPAAANPRRELVGFTMAFAALIALDCAAFAIIQQTASLHAGTWRTPVQQLMQGTIHLIVAVVAGMLVDRGGLRWLMWTAMALFVVALPFMNGPLYAAAVSCYSVALVTYPSLQFDSRSRWRAAWTYGIGGWVGSALGIGMIQQMHAIPPAAIGAAALLVLLGHALSRRAVVAGLVVFATCSVRADDLASQIARGRAVYVSEGCIHCHSQFIRPGTRDVEMWGPFRAVDRREKPPLIGNRRQGPDLMNIGNRRHPLWNRLHLIAPQSVSPGSRMPSYAHLFSGNESRGDDLVAYLASCGSTTIAERVQFIQSWAPVDGGASIESGRHRFQESCRACHGVDGDGDGPVAGQLYDPAISLRDGPFRFAPGPNRAVQLARVVKFGIPGMPMPGHEYFSDEDIRNIVAFLETLVPADDQ